MARTADAHSATGSAEGVAEEEVTRVDGVGSGVEDAPGSVEETAQGMAAQSRRLRNSILSLAVFFLIVAGLLLAVPGLRTAGERITDAKWGWVAAAVVAQLWSCASYVVLFGLVFARIGRRLSSRLSLAELAVNSVVSAGGLGGIALGAWVLRSKGISVERIAKRSVLFFVLTSAVNVSAVVLIGLGMWLGLLPGSQRALITLLPATAALLTIIGTLAAAGWARRAAARRSSEHGRTVVALVALGGGVEDAVGLIRSHDWRLLGAVGYWLLDTVCLFLCMAAYGSTPTFWAVAMAYLVGMLANSIPIPGGFFAVEGGLVGMLLLFGARPASTVLAAVVTYRAISLWIPALIGTAAFVSLRGEIGKPLRPQPGGAGGR
ncbi:MAG TPA: lysylphosphatidylglycerol synthase transmembrane domain-containing protein [Solirubrobacteraceae bacterium]|nr:lysylphosphatidylglycerol synthase transmembrane domain-containing protein [Solirubrobacteraceae bacterium]